MRNSQTQRAGCSTRQGPCNSNLELAELAPRHSLVVALRPHCSGPHTFFPLASEHAGTQPLWLRYDNAGICARARKMVCNCAASVGPGVRIFDSAPVQPRLQHERNVLHCGNSTIQQLNTHDLYAEHFPTPAEPPEVFFAAALKAVGTPRQRSWHHDRASE